MAARRALLFAIGLITWLLSVILTSAGHASIRFGVAAEPYPPFTSKDAAGEWVGWEIDLMNAVCRAMKEECSIVEVSWDGIIPALNANFFDVIWSSMGITEDRLAVIDFTVPYYATPVILVGERNGDRDISPVHLQGKIVGAQGGTIHEKYLKKHYSRNKLKIYHTQDEAFQDLTAGRVDYVQGDMIPLLDFLETPVGKTCCEFKGELPVDPEIFGIGAAGGIRKGDVALKNKLNAALKLVRESGEQKAISRKYFPFDIAPKSRAATGD